MKTLLNGYKFIISFVLPALWIFLLTGENFIYLYIKNKIRILKLRMQGKGPNGRWLPGNKNRIKSCQSPFRDKKVAVMPSGHCATWHKFDVKKGKIYDPTIPKGTIYAELQ